MNLFLQINADGTVRANNLISAYAGFGRDIAVGIGNTHISRIVPDRMMSALYGSRDQFLQKLLVPERNCRWALRQSGQKKQE